MLDLKITQGNSLKIRIKMTDAKGSPVNMSTLEIAEILWVVKELPTSATPVIEKRYTQGEITIEDVAEAQLLITLVNDDTQNLLGNYFHEAALLTTDGDMYTIVADDDMDNPTFTVRKSITGLPA